jgi:hypothetical protein
LDLTTRTGGRQRLWTLVSLLPIAVLCGVVAYAYLIRPWRAAGKTKPELRAAEAWAAQAAGYGIHNDPASYEAAFRWADKQY